MKYFIEEFLADADTVDKNLLSIDVNEILSCVTFILHYYGNLNEYRFKYLITFTELQKLMEHIITDVGILNCGEDGSNLSLSLRHHEDQVFFAASIDCLGFILCGDVCDALIAAGEI